MTDENQLDELKNQVKSLVEQQSKLLEQQESMLKQLSNSPVRVKKDFWEKIGAIAPILSGTIIAIGGTLFTISYNQQQLKLQEAQTIERFIPHLLGDEKSKRAAILAISTLTEPKLAAKVASIFASPGTVSALESIAENDTSPDKKALKGTLVRALDNMAERYRMDKQFEDAIVTYKKALDLQEQQAGVNSPELVPHLDRLSELSSIHKDYNEAEGFLRRAADIEKGAHGAESIAFAAQLRRLASLYKEQGLDSKSTSVLSQAIAIEQKSPATATGATVVSIPEHLEKGGDSALTGQNASGEKVPHGPELPEVHVIPPSTDGAAKASTESAKTTVSRPLPEGGSQEPQKNLDVHEPESSRPGELGDSRSLEQSSERPRRD